MRLNTYDNVMVQPSTVSAVAIQSLTGSSAVNGDSVDTGVTFDADSAMIHVRTEIASGTPTTATVAWALQESSDNSTWVAANDNTGTAIGATLNTKTVANDSYARVEGKCRRCPRECARRNIRTARAPLCEECRTRNYWKTKHQVAKDRQSVFVSAPLI